jgi:small subunit ribosomal protein S13
MSILLTLNTNDNVKLIYSLRNIYGIGLLSAKKICSSLGFDVNTKMTDLKEEDLNKINALINVKYKFSTDSEKKKNTYDNIQHMKNIKCYKGVRHSYNLPVNGQRTHTNAKTRGWR